LHENQLFSATAELNSTKRKALDNQEIPAKCKSTFWGEGVFRRAVTKSNDVYDCRYEIISKDCLTLRGEI